MESDRVRDRLASRSACASRRGAALVEFALVSLALYLVLAAGIELGRLVLVDQVLEDAARVAARELALRSLPAGASFEDALADPAVQQAVYDEGKLVIDRGQFASEADLQQHLASLPVVNRMLVPLMIEERATVSGVELDLLRYPGALWSDPSTSTGYSVRIPRVLARDASGVETIDWVDVLEEVRCDPCDPATGAFSLAAPDPAPACLPPGAPRGLVAVRLNYPFQAAMLSGYRQSAEGPLEPNGSMPILAADDAVTVQLAPGCPPPDGSLVPASGPGVGTYAGTYALGSQLAMATTVRPFRRLLSTQAVFRREVFQ